MGRGVAKERTIPRDASSRVRLHYKGFVHDIMDNVDPTKLYLRRFHLVRRKLFGVYLHKILRADNDRYPHSHPWGFYTLILKGGYTEQVVHEDGTVATYDRRPGSIHYVPRRGYWHSVRKLHGPCTWSLVFRGRRNERHWGYLRYMDFWPATGPGGGIGPEGVVFDGDGD
jgi:hypothetical protein